MKFDDRLATVISSRVTDAHDQAVRWRQLVDLVARAGSGAQGVMIDEALGVIRGGRDRIPEALRAAAARAIVDRDVSPALLELFASDTVEVAAPLLTKAASHPSVRAAASPDVRRLLDALHPVTTQPDVLGGAPPEEGASQESTPQPAETTPLSTMPSIGEVVARIEQLRAARAAPEAKAPLPERISAVPPVVPTPPIIPSGVGQSSGAARSALSEGQPAMFRWECGPGGDIAWVEGAPRAALVGRSIARADALEGVDPTVEQAFARRSPFSDGRLALPDDGSFAGEWSISGLPAFAREDGRFVGYRGVARRSETEVRADEEAAGVPNDPSALRELVHEIRTPLNAIMGFAEIIDGQYLGPAQSGYRERAAEIVAQSRTLLAAVEDLDFVARLRSSRGEGGPYDVGALFAAAAGRLRAQADARAVGLMIDPLPAGALCAVNAALAERLMERFAGALIELAQPHEPVRLKLTCGEGGCALEASTPVAVRERPADPSIKRDAEGAGLRLVAGLARIAGSRIERRGEQIVLSMPPRN